MTKYKLALCSTCRVLQVVLVIGMVMIGRPAVAQRMSLEECRRRALADNKGLKMADEKKAQTEALEQMALWQMLPKVSANGGYVWMQESPSLLSREQQAELNSLGTALQGHINQEIIDALAKVGISGQQLTDAINSWLSNTRLEQGVNGVGQRITSALDLDMSSIGAGAITVTQPLYMGGKLVAMYRSAELMDNLSDIQRSQKRDEVMAAVDEAYYAVVNLQQKTRLAEQYEELLDTLESHVEELLEAGLATTGDLAKVRVKHNEARMSLTQASGGLVLAKMLLAQRCGMPLEGSVSIEVEDSDELLLSLSGTSVDHSTIDMEQVWNRRHEMQMLRISDSVAMQGVRIAASTLKPNVAITGGYLVSNPNLFDGFQNKWGGTAMAGIVVNVPIMHPGGIYAVRAAKHKRNEIAYQMAEAEEMIELQVNKLRYELDVAYRQLAESHSNTIAAEENLRLAEESFKAGMCSSGDLMQAQTAWQKAHSDEIDAAVNIKLGRVRLQQALGESLNK